MTLQKFGTPPPGTKLTIERIYNDNERQDEPKGERYLSGVPFWPHHRWFKKRFKWAKIPLIDKKMTKTQYQEKMKQWSQQYDTTTFDGDWN